MHNLAQKGSGNGVEKLRKQWQQVLNAIALAVNQDDRNRELRQVLLERQVPIDRYKDVELGLSQRQELPVGDTSPALAYDGLGVKACDVRSKTSVNALVEQNFQAAAVTAKPAAFSRNSTTCERCTEGNAMRKVSMLSPASKNSMSD